MPAYAEQRLLSRAAFLRTPKKMVNVPILDALFTTQWEAAIGAVWLAMGSAVLIMTGQSAIAYLIGGLLLWQVSLYLAVPVHGLFHKSRME